MQILSLLHLLKLLYVASIMSKDIEMFQISDKEVPIGTEVFDANLPSNIDFEEHEHEHEHIEKVPFNPEKVARMGKVLTIGEEMKSYRVVGKATANLQPHHFKGALINSKLHTFAAKVFDEESRGGFMKLWSSIIGYTKREIHFSDGFIYFLQPTKEGLHLYQVMSLSSLFKVFIDPEQDKIRLVFTQGEKLLNKDISPDRFIGFLEHLLQQLSKVGLGLQQ